MKRPSKIHLDARLAGRRLFLGTGAAWLLSGALQASAEDPTIFRRGVHRVTPLCSLPPADYQHGARSPSAIVRSQLAIPLTQPRLIGQAIEAIRDLVPPPAMIPAMTPALTSVPVVPRALTVPPLPMLPERARVEADDVRELQRLAELDRSQTLIDAATVPSAKLILLGEREISVLHCEISDLALLIEKNGRWNLSFRADQNPVSRRSDAQRNLELHLKRNAFNVSVRLLHSSRVGGEALSVNTLTANATDQAGKLSIAQVTVDEFWVEREAPAYIKRHGFDPAIAQHFDMIDQAEVEFFVRLDPLTGNGRGVINPWQREP